MKMKAMQSKPRHDRTISPSSSLDHRPCSPATTATTTANQHHGLLPPPPTAATSHRLATIKQTFHYLYDYLYSIEPDTIFGQDALEGLFRSFSITGEYAYLATEENAASGGYVEYLFKSLAYELYDVNLWDMKKGTLPYIPGRNPDMMELDLHSYY